MRLDNMGKNLIAKYAPVGSLVIILASALCGMSVYITGSMHNVELRLNTKIDKVEANLVTRIECLEKDVAIIKTVLLMKGIIPPELATNERE